jgi:3-hydroxyacyl-CoA dehydrogenase/enoyl-CoA hydratase/3-hydroxybutyryl-CoA epimerase
MPHGLFSSSLLLGRFCFYGIMAMTPALLAAIEELNAGAHRPAHVPASRLKKIGILGAGFMGAGIAAVTARAGFDAVLIDQSQALADQGKAKCAAWISLQVSQGEAKAADEEMFLSRIQASADEAGLSDCDLVIETIFEDRAAKVAALLKAQAICAGAVFASNTSTFPITSLAQGLEAQGLERAADFIGIHFFSPVQKMGLVELVLGKKTSDRALAVAFDYVRAIGKTPVVVNDGYEFFANRCVNRYLREGHLMLLEGVPPHQIESSARSAGMPVGPLALSDEVAIDLVYKILLAMKKDLGPAAIDRRQENLLEAMVVTHGRHGRKNGRGFYDYPQDAPKSLWSGLADFQFSKRHPLSVDTKDLQARFLAIQAIEAVRAMEEGIVSDPREIDAGSVLGFGFPPLTGGVLSYIDAMGANVFLSLCERLATAHGERLLPPELLKDIAKIGGTFTGGSAK